jgi:hypothetical protein
MIRDAEEKRLLEDQCLIGEGNINMDPKEIRRKVVDSIHMAQNGL